VAAGTASVAGHGTPAEMAPEQIRGGRLGPATDAHALDVLPYQLLTGGPPFDPAGRCRRCGNTTSPPVMRTSMGLTSSGVTNGRPVSGGTGLGGTGLGHGTGQRGQGTALRAG
jgi:serine/threonine protein kinase